ncbi:hypothetical protein [Pseudomonas aeruginosa]|uniref:hypothetical protein n=1 Tax=Pseudomonas aeruginosa TaxID=287 RepID=UPI0037B784F8
MPDVREEFEAWVSGRKVCTRYGAKLTTNPDGMYSDYRINDRWMAWQASRATLKVELPFPVIVDEGAEFAFHAYDKDEMDKALQQAGIEVK